MDELDADAWIEHLEEHMKEIVKISGQDEQELTVRFEKHLEEYKRIAAAITQGRCHAKPYENEDEELLKETFGKKGLLEEIRKENEPELLETISPQHLEKCLNGIECHVPASYPRQRSLH